MPTGEECFFLKVTILVGTMTGTAELVAQEVRDALAPRGCAAEIVLMDGLGPEAFEDGGAFLICTSTYGQGDVPDNAQALFTALEAARPDLSQVEYGVIALGDRTYAATFCDGGKRFDALLSSLGATRLGEPLTFDASSGEMPEDAGVAWACNWVDEHSPRLGRAA
jgi:MioC protein